LFHNAPKQPSSIDLLSSWTSKIITLRFETVSQFKIGGVAAAFRLRNILKSHVQETQAVGANGRSPLLVSKIRITTQSFLFRILIKPRPVYLKTFPS